MTSEAFVYDTVRTPFGKYAGALAGPRPDGTVTAGNASPLNDGASAVLLGSAAAEGLLGLAPPARVAGLALVLENVRSAQ